MLLAMPNTADPTEPDAPSSPVTPDSATTFQPSPASTTFSPGPAPRERHRSSRSITSLSTITTAPATFAHQNSASASAIAVKGYSLGTESEDGDAEQAAAGIGAMMLGTGSGSSMVESNGLSPTLGAERTERNGSVSSQATITAGHAFAYRPNGTESPSSGSPTQQVSMDRRAEDDFLEFSPTSTQDSASPTLPAIHFTHERERAPRQRAESNSSVESSGVEPVTALEFGSDWPTDDGPAFGSTLPVEALGDEPQPASSGPAFEGISTDTVVPEPQRFSMVGRDFATFLPTSANMGRTSSAQTATSSSTMQRLPSTDSAAMSRQASGESFMSNRTSASIFGGQTFPAVQDGPRPRANRSVSLNNPSTYTPVLATTSAGTISQRRARPGELARTGSSAGLERLQNEAVVEEEEGDDTVRLSHSPASWGEQQQHDEFGAGVRAGGLTAGTPPASVPSGPGHYISASLPTRMRALSQPGKRPAFPQYESERPAMPPMLSQAARSVSVSAAGSGLPRKLSLGGSNLQAPYSSLGRTASGSSVTSDGRAAGAAGGEGGTPLTSQFGAKAGQANGSVNLMLGPPAPNASELAQVAAVRRPFQLMSLLLASITHGAHLSPRLYVPKQAWTLSGVKLAQLEAKARSLEPLFEALKDVNEAGAGFLDPPSGGPAWEGYRADPEARQRFVRALDALDGLMDGLHASLHKKLGDAVAAPSGRKASGAGAGLAAWGGKLSRSLDRVTNGRAVDAPGVYVEWLGKVLGQAGGLERHLVGVLEGEGGYGTMEEGTRGRVEARLRRAGEFFGGTVCRFVLRDVGVLMDKYLKRLGNQICAE